MVLYLQLNTSILSQNKKQKIGEEKEKVKKQRLKEENEFVLEEDFADIFKNLNATQSGSVDPSILSKTKQEKWDSDDDFCIIKDQR